MIINQISGGVNTNDATATAADIIAPKTAYVNGVKLTGTAVVGKQVLIGTKNPDSQSSFSISAIGFTPKGFSVRFERPDGDNTDSIHNAFADIENSIYEIYWYQRNYNYAKDISYSVNGDTLTFTRLCGSGFSGLLRYVIWG